MGLLNSDPRINRLLKLFTQLFPVFLLLSIIIGLTIENKIIIFLSLPLSILASILALLITEIVGNIGGKIYWPSKKSNPGDQFSADLAKARFSNGNGRFEEALTIINGVLEKDPDFPDALYLKGRILWEGFDDSIESKKIFMRVKQLISTEEELCHWSSYYIDKISEHHKRQNNGSDSDDT